MTASAMMEARHFCSFGCCSCGRRPGNCTLALNHFAVSNSTVLPLWNARAVLFLWKRLVARIRANKRRHPMARLEPKFYGAACRDSFTVTFPPIFNCRRSDCVDPIPLEYVLGLERSAYDSGGEGTFFLFPT